MEPDIDSAFAELGLASDATERDVKAAWRRLVSQWHPDRNGSAAALAKMQRINRAVETIRRAGFRKPDDAPPSPREPDERAAQPPRAEPPARTIRRRVRLTLEEAAFGCTKVLRGKLTQACSACEGAGYRVLGGHCPRCHGSGAIHRRSWFGWAGARSECDACHGGGIARQACDACAGSGKAETERYQVTVRFPHGVRDGDVLGVDAHLRRPGTLPGHLSIRVEVQPHPLLQLGEDGTVLCEVPVDGFAWVANRPLEVPTLDGLRPLALQRHQLAYRLEGLGFPVERRGKRGDQLITIVPIFPQQLSADQQALIDRLIATTSDPKGKHRDERLRAWNEALQRHERPAPPGRA